MRECEQDVLGQYEIDIKEIKKVRGGSLCHTEKECFLLEKTRLSEGRLSLLEKLSEHLRKEGFENVDYIIRNREGVLGSEWEDGSRYVLKKWYAGRECDIKKENELLNATKNLTRLHKALQSPIDWGECDGNLCQAEDLAECYFRHNRELKKVRSFIRGKVDKGEFEHNFLRCFETMYEWAEGALERLKESNYKEIKRKPIHGDYNYHNILILHEGMATTNFEHLEENIQVTDFYYFLRKALEKHQWDLKLGEKMVDYYQRFLPLGKMEMDYLAVSLAYPEKFWKAANSYAKSKKSLISAKSLEKLEMVTKQMEAKQEFLEKVLDFRL